MNCNYTLSTTLDLYFKQKGFVDVCVNRSGSSTVRYYFNDENGDTRELVVNNNDYSIVDVNNVSFNGMVYSYRDYSTVSLLIISSIVIVLFLEKILGWVFGLGKRGKISD